MMGWAEFMVDGQGSGNTDWSQITNANQSVFQEGTGVILISSVPVLTSLSLYTPSQSRQVGVVKNSSLCEGSFL